MILLYVSLMFSLQLFEAVVKCWASQFAMTAIHYRRLVHTVNHLLLLIIIMVIIIIIKL